MSALSGELQDLIKPIFERGFNLQMEFLIGFAVAQVPATFLMLRKEDLLWFSRKT
jgi:hypothetical protein